VEVQNIAKTFAWRRHMTRTPREECGGQQREEAERMLLGVHWGASDQL